MNDIQSKAREIGNSPAFPGGMTLRQYYLGNFPDMATVDMMLEQLAIREYNDACAKEKEPIKTGWENAPDWARWKAMDEDGRWFWWSEKPESHTDGIWIGGGHADLIPNHPATNKDWAETLEERKR